MQAITCMQTSSPKSASERLLEAAMEVFAREGITRATTREIAKVAGVNEVTLFRNFQNKQGLLAAVLESSLLITESLQKSPSLENGATLKEVLTYFARTDFDRKLKNITLMRVLVGDIHQLGDHEAEVLKRIFQPWKDELNGQLREADRRGLLRPGVNPLLIVDQLVAMIFIGALRVDVSRWCISYSPDEYVTACVDTIYHAIISGKERPLP
ncbi:MAG: transcriptional regulator, TetR family [Akkermansiaceae bacterium]|nr:transcriptional regulator, TetR family [Akkermansiaceae bacterium]